MLMVNAKHGLKRIQKNLVDAQLLHHPMTVQDLYLYNICLVDKLWISSGQFRGYMNVFRETIQERSNHWT